MVDSRRPSSPEPGQDGAQALLSGALREAFDALPDGVATLAAAVSGGPDSSALAVLAAEMAVQRGLTLHLFHVHHGLHPMADAWATQTEQLALRLGVACSVARVSVDASDRRGVEAAARSARYAALGEMARAAGVAHVLLAHHQDDQVETVMLRMLRGAGLDGMGAMAFESWTDAICYLRPWLPVTRSRILAFMQAYTRQTGFEPVQDPSNLDARYARGALRTDILPAIERNWPGYRATFERFARLASEAALVLREVAVSDLAAIQEDRPPFWNCLNLARLHRLPAARQTMALRLWLGGHGLAMPSEARLQELQRQLARPAIDKHMLLNHGGVHVRRYRDWAIVDRAAKGVDVMNDDATEIIWNGEAELPLVSFGGRLRFGRGEHGLDPAWLRGVPLVIRWRRGRERLKLSPLTPSRSLKNLYQERGIPSWERERLPLVYRHDTLVYAAGLGVDVRLPQAEPGVSLIWVADRPGATVIS